jgi:hypothetical protein
VALIAAAVATAAAGAVAGCATHAPVEAGPARCEGVAADVSAIGARGLHAQAICEGVRDAFGFLAPLGLALPQHLAVEAVDAMPPGLGRGVVGCFERASGRVVILDYEAFEQSGRWLGVEPDLAAYRSVVAHEVTHAVLHCHLPDDDALPRVAHEYVAYVAMFATMDAALRELVLLSYPGEGFDDVSQVNLLSYVFDPVAFGVEAYRHWRRQPDGLGFLRAVIDGKIIREMQID